MDASITTLSVKTPEMSDSVQDSSSIWDEISRQLQASYGDAVYRSWFKPLQFDSVCNGQAILVAPTRFMREWVVNNYLDTLVDLFHSYDRQIHAVDIVVKRTTAPVASSASTSSPARHHISWGATSSGNKPSTQAPASQVPPVMHDAQDSGDESILSAMGATLDPRYTFDNYIVGKPNELAFAAARRVAESRECTPGCNPLFLYGGVGLGKTHLMHAIAWHLRHTNPERRVVYLSAEKFMYQFIKALKDRSTMEFKEQFRSVDVLMVDDVQFISGKDSTQEEFFHTFNALVDQNKQLVISADRSPSDLEGMEERMRSRLGWGLVADVHATNYELRYGILQSKVEQSVTPVPKEVIEFLASRITTNIRELEGALNRVIANTTLVGQPVTLETTQQVLSDLLRSCDKRATIEDIQKQVADYYNIKVSDMHSGRRSVSIARPRQIAMYLSKQLTSKSLPEIGRKFGGKDHTTVMHGVKRITELMQNDAEVRDDVERLQRMLSS